jgi:hypothetical protein
MRVLHYGPSPLYSEWESNDDGLWKCDGSHRALGYSNTLASRDLVSDNS